MVQFYPKTFFLLCRELEESVSELFLKWYNWVNSKLNRLEHTITPQDFYMYFEDFSLQKIDEKHVISRKYIYDILKYEKMALNAAEFSDENQLFSFDINKIDDMKPIKARKALIGRFDFNLSVIIIDMREGNLKKHYDGKETYMVFYHDGDMLDVSEINHFTRDFLELSDGTNSIKDICRKLFPRYGSDMKEEDFFDSCKEAVQVLGEMGLLSTR
jgi:hypothetical protein